jgi:unsaturated rhamnogalacturonyl hydrolase
VEQLDKIFKRFCWVADELRSPEGLYYHAGNGKDSVCQFFWLRAIGWYAMAQVDVMEYMPEKFLPEMKKNLKIFIDGMLKYQDESGMWKNLVDQPLTDSNRLETSGSAMMVYCILKAIRLGWLDDADGKYASAAKKAFCYMVEKKLTDDGLTDIYLMAAASGVNNYETLSWYKTNEGKGIGPFIMAYSEMSRR